MVLLMQSTRLGLKENDYRGIITHYAKVKENGIKSGVLVPYDFEKFPNLKKLSKEKGWDSAAPCKTYSLEWIKELPNPIPHQKGDPARGQRYFSTTLNELRKAKVLKRVDSTGIFIKNKLLIYKYG